MIQSLQMDWYCSQILTANPLTYQDKLNALLDLGTVSILDEEQSSVAFCQSTYTPGSDPSDALLDQAAVLILHEEQEQ